MTPLSRCFSFEPEMERTVALSARTKLVASLRLALALGGLSFVLVASEAGANSCQQSCRAAWNQCRIATKGSPSCDAQLQACMASCLPKR